MVGGFSYIGSGSHFFNSSITAGGSKQNQPVIIMPPLPEKPVAVLIIHGVQDQSVHIEGGKQEKSFAKHRYMLSAADTLSWWAQANKSIKYPVIEFDPELNSTVVAYSSGIKDAQVVKYFIQNAWPGSKEKPYRRAPEPALQFPANDLIWDFFKQNP